MNKKEREEILSIVGRKMPPRTKILVRLFNAKALSVETRISPNSHTRSNELKELSDLGYLHRVYENGYYLSSLGVAAAIGAKELWATEEQSRSPRRGGPKK